MVARPIGSEGVRSRIDSMLYEWAEQECVEIHKSGVSSINVVERLLRDPGGTQIAEHKILWWPKNKRIARVSKASHQLTPMERMILVFHYGSILNDDKTRMKKRDLVKCNKEDLPFSSLTSRDYEKTVKAAKRKISKILRAYDRWPLTRWT